MSRARQLLLATRKAGTTYYVDATNGSDSNSGRLPSAAWQTLDPKVNGETFRPDDHARLKRGEEWREKLIPPDAGLPGSFVTFGDYGTGALPIINGSDLVVEWSDEGDNIWSAALTTDPTHVLFDSVRGTQETLLGNLDALLEWFWAANVLYVYSTSDPDTAYVSPGIEAAVREDSVFIDAKSYIRLQNIRVVNSQGDNILVQNSDYCRFDGLEVYEARENGLSVRACDHCAVSGGHYYYNGTTSDDPDYAENVGCGILLWDTSTLNVIGPVESDHNAEDGVAFGGSTGLLVGTGNSVVGSNLHHNLEDGLDIKNGDQSASDCIIASNVHSACVSHDDAGVMTLNRCVCTGAGVGTLNSHLYVTTGAGARTYEAYGCFFGAIADTTATVALTANTGPHKFINCIFEPGATNRLLQIQGGSGHVVEHCTLYNPGGLNSLLRFTTNAANVTVINNTLYSVGIPCLRYDTGVTVLAADNNAYYRSGSVDGWLDYQGTIYDKADIDDGTVYAEKGTDDNSITGDPLFVVLGTDFHLQAGSPCRGAGATGTGVTDDYDGVARGSPPDIGAYEYVPS